MADVIKFLGSPDISNINEKITWRQTNFDEPLMMSIGVVLMNYGDSYIKVRCVNNEFEGTKADLAKRDGIPLCPNGHPLFELSTAPRLALVEGE